MISANTKQRGDYYSIMETAKELAYKKDFEKRYNGGFNKEHDEGFEKRYKEIFEKRYEEEFEKGYKEGGHISALKIATKLKANGYSINEIAELTELSVEEIEKL